MSKYVVVNTKVEPSYEDPFGEKTDPKAYNADTLEEAIHRRNSEQFSDAVDGIYSEWTIYEEVSDPDSKVTKWFYKIAEWLDNKARCGY